jgi:hypothetical protein
VRATRRTGAFLALAGLALVLAAGPAAADPPRPTDYRSTITAGASGDGFDVDVVGGDSLLRLVVDDGHEVVVLGYRDEPYLRISADGTVERNRRSEATYINEDRYGGDGELPAEVDPDAEPDWEEVGDGGTYAWHDHRIHWMSPERPAGIEPGGTVLEWEVPFEVDGQAHEVTGVLTLEARQSPIPWIALTAGVIAVALLLDRRLGSLVAPAVAIIGTVAALVAGLGEIDAIPPEAGRNPFVVAVPVVGLVAAVCSVLARRRPVNLPAIAAAACVLGWVAFRLPVLTRPVLPTSLPAGFDRASTAVALGAGLTVALGAALGPGRHRPRA